MPESYPLPAGVGSRVIAGVNGLDMHVLEAGDAGADKPCLLLLHGFPELAYSWRKVMRSLAEAGYYVVAPDQRGYGRTTGWDGRYDGDLGSFGMLNLVRDALTLLAALGRRSVAAVIGHDFGAPVAATCALVRPDVFRSVVLMSAPFPSPPPLPLGAPSRLRDQLDAALAALDPPRQHYQTYYGTREADADMRYCPQGIHAFLRAYYHVKSADWRQNRPHRLAAMSAAELAKLPTYYIMEAGKNMAETVAAEMPSPTQIAGCRWLPEEELAVYSAEFARTGFQGGLQWYRCMRGQPAAELALFAGRTIDVPSAFIAGRSDWGIYQFPGALERMERDATTRYRGTHLVDGAGHWVQQEQPEAVVRLLLDFLRSAAT